MRAMISMNACIFLSMTAKSACSAASNHMNSTISIARDIGCRVKLVIPEEVMSKGNVGDHRWVASKGTGPCHVMFPTAIHDSEQHVEISFLSRICTWQGWQQSARGGCWNRFLQLQKHPGRSWETPENYRFQVAYPYDVVCGQLGPISSVF